MWDLTKVFVQPRVKEDQQRLEDLLAADWEPFAVTSSGQAGNVIWLKRLVVK